MNAAVFQLHHQIVVPVPVGAVVTLTILGVVETPTTTTMEDATAILKQIRIAPLLFSKQIAGIRQDKCHHKIMGPRTWDVPPVPVILLKPAASNSREDSRTVERRHPWAVQISKADHMPLRLQQNLLALRVSYNI
jgi:hypothetical protein